MDGVLGEMDLGFRLGWFRVSRVEVLQGGLWVLETMKGWGRIGARDLDSVEVVF